MRLCTITDCAEPHEGRGFCVKHLRRWHKHGDPLRSDAPQGTPAQRFEAQVDKVPGGCWLWTGSDVSREGYARFKVERQRVLVHRWSFEHHVRPLVPGEVIDHLCNTPRCANPEHLLPGTQRRNVLRSATAGAAVNARKTHCLNGHAFDEVNTYVNARGIRQCRRCRADREAARRARLR